MSGSYPSDLVDLTLITNRLLGCQLVTLTMTYLSTNTHNIVYVQESIERGFGRALETLVINTD